MELSRRQFIRSVMVLGGSLAFPPLMARASGGNAHAPSPAYRILEDNGELAARVEQAHEILRSCRLCPRQCGVNRLAGERGFCRAPARVMIYSAHPHFGEEIPLVGENGSGTVFFSNCNLRCVFCQNWPIAHEGKGREITDAELAGLMLALQEQGCANINLVTPTHVMPHILSAVRIAARRGLSIPLVYNTSGYERVPILELLDGIVDIYLPDMKYTDGLESARYSEGAENYPEVTRAAIEEMHRQVNDLETDGGGIARRGLMIRHLVMPNGVAGTETFVHWVADHLSMDTYVNIMAQYRVAYRAYEFPRISRGVTAEEFLQAMKWAEEAGLTRLDAQSVRVRDFYQTTTSGVRRPETDPRMRGQTWKAQRDPLGIA